MFVTGSTVLCVVLFMNSSVPLRAASQENGPGAALVATFETNSVDGDDVETLDRASIHSGNSIVGTQPVAEVDSSSRSEIVLAAVEGQDSADTQIAVRVPGRTTLRIQAMPRQVCDCAAQPWIAFIGSDGLIWPRLMVRLQDHPRGLDVSIAVPADFESGKLALVCVSRDSAEKFQRWIDDGMDAPLNQSGGVVRMLAVSSISVVEE